MEVFWKTTRVCLSTDFVQVSVLGGGGVPRGWGGGESQSCERGGGRASRENTCFRSWEKPNSGFRCFDIVEALKSGFGGPIEHRDLYLGISVIRRNFLLVSYDAPKSGFQYSAVAI